MRGTVIAFPARQANRGAGVRPVGARMAGAARATAVCPAGARAAARPGWPAGRPPPAFRQSNETDRRVRARPAARGRSMRTGGIARHRARIIRTATGGIGLACPVDHHIAANQQHECQDAQDRRGRCARLLERRVAKRARDARRPRVKGARRMRGIRCAGIESNGQFRRPQTGQCSSARKATKPHSLQRKLAVRRVSARAVRIARQSSRERMVRLGRTRIAGSGRAPSTRRTFAGRHDPFLHGSRSARAGMQGSVPRRLSFACGVHGILRDIGCAEYVRP